MTSVDVSVDIKPAQQAMLALGGIFQQQPYLVLVGQRLLAWVNQNFVQHGAEIPWAPLSPNTIASRRGGGVGAQPLRDTGRMAMSFVSEVGPGMVTVGTADQMAVWHHFGTRPYTIHPKNRKRFLRFTVAGKGVVYSRVVHHPGLPARPLLPSQIFAERLATDVLTAYLEEVTRGLR